MRLIALMIIAASFILSGLFIAYRLTGRAALLEKCVMMINAMRADIEFLHRPSDEIIAVLSSRKDLRELKFLSECNRLIEEGKDFKTAWTQALGKNDNYGCLNEKDVGNLLSFSELFGVTADEGQSSNCQLYHQLLQASCDEAKINRDKYSKLAIVLGLFTGIGFIIVFG